MARAWCRRARSLVRTGVDLGPWLVAQGITIVSTVPTLAALWPTDALDEVRLLIFGGEACPPELAERVVVEGREVWNTYGPTEATVVACAAQLTGDGPVRIGLPLAGWQLAVVGNDGEPVAMGETGELVIGGAGLARYLDEAKDAEKFAPQRALGWQRAYRSGDVVRAEPDGLLFVGRADEQVKLSAAGGSSWARSTRLCSRCPMSPAPLARCRKRLPATKFWSGMSSRWGSPSIRTRPPSGFASICRPLWCRCSRLSTTCRRVRPARSTGPRCRGHCPMWTLRAADLTPTEVWLAASWADILGIAVSTPNADFFLQRRRKSDGRAAGRADSRTGTRRSRSSTFTRIRSWARSLGCWTPTTAHMRLVAMSRRPRSGPAFCSHC